jgi:hypothetical protein
MVACVVIEVSFTADDSITSPIEEEGDRTNGGSYKPSNVRA